MPPKKEYNVNRVMAEWLIVGLILFALFVEVILHKLEHWVAHKHAHLQAVLRNLYRELMILGMVSFGFILYIFIKSPDGNIKLTFEVAHIFIFLFAVFHTIVVMCTIFISLRLSARWKSLERMEVVRYLEKKDKYRKLVDRLEAKSGVVWRYYGWWFPKVSRPFRYWKLHEVMAFHDIRFQFIYYRNLPMDFRFSSFLRKIKATTFIELVEIHWTHFLFLLAVTLLDIARIEAKAKFGIYFEPAFLIASSVFNMWAVTVLGWKVRKVYWKMTRNPATYYDHVDRHTLEREALVEEEMKRIEAESQPQSRRMSRTFERKSDVKDDDTDEGASIRKSVDMDRPRVSTDRRSRRQSNIGAPNTAHSAHKPVYQNLAYVPPKSVPSSGTHTPSVHEDDLGLGEVVARHSLDVNRESTLDTSRVRGGIDVASDRPSARSSFDKPRNYVPSSSLTNKDGSIAMDAVAAAAQRRRSSEVRRTSVDNRFTRSSQDSRRPDRDRGVSRDRRDSNASRRTSLDISSTLPVDDLARRNANTRPLRRNGNANGPEVIDVSDDGQNLDRAEMRKLAMKRIAEKSKPTPGLIGHYKDNEAAKSADVKKQYPKWLVKCLPRLGRVATPAEKLFWFGSPKFYLWCVEWVLFFTTINLSATLAKVGTATKKRNSLKPGIPKEDYTLLIVALAIAFVAMFYMLIRIADIMKKYIFVLNNAALLPETLTIEAIQTVRIKDLMHGGKHEFEPVYVDASDTETETEGGEYRQARHNMSTFFSSEVEGGRMPGVTSADDEKRAVSVSSRRESDRDDVEAVAEANWQSRASNV